MEALSDNALMFKVKEGDLDKLGLLFERYKKQLFKFFYRLNDEAKLSEDLVQEVFMRVLKYRHTFKGTGPFKVWLFHIARNVNYGYHRRNKGTLNDSLEEKHEELSLYDEETSSQQMNDHLALLKMAIQRLDMEKREVIMLSKLDEMKYKDIGKVLDCSEGAVKTKVFRALKDLKMEFEKIRKYYG